MEISGKIKMIGATQNVSSSFKKRELVVETSEQYPQPILVNFVQDKCDLLNNYKVGQEVKVGINLRGRQWVNPQGETKYFNDIQGWKIEALNAVTKLDNKPEQGNDIPFKEEDHDDLPF